MINALTIAQSVWLELLRKKDIYVLLILLGAILCALVSLNAFGLGSTTRYVTDTGLLMTWIFAWVLGILASSRALPQEEERGTVFPMLAKPLTRFEFLLGKWIGTWNVITAATLLFYLLVTGVVLLRGGRLIPATLLQAFILHTAALAVMSSVAVALSTRLNADAAATLTFVFTAAAFVVVPRVPELLVKQQGVGGLALYVLYYVLPHFELFDMRRRLVHDYGPAPAGAIIEVLLYGLSLTAVFILLGWIGYRRKVFSRSHRV